MTIPELRDTLILLTRTPAWPRAALAAGWLAGVPIVELAGLAPDDTGSIIATDDASIAALHRLAGTIDTLASTGWARWDTEAGRWAVSGDDTHLTIAVDTATTRALLTCVADNDGHTGSFTRWIDGDRVTAGLDTAARRAWNAALGTDLTAPSGDDEPREPPADT